MRTIKRESYGFSSLSAGYVQEVNLPDGAAAKQPLPLTESTESTVAIMYTAIISFS